METVTAITENSNNTERKFHKRNVRVPERKADLIDRCVQCR